MEMYFIALVAPDEVNKQVLQWKNFMKERFGCLAALRSPAHITLIPPFWLKEELENGLTSALSSFSAAEKPFTVRLQNFSGFPPKTLFLHVHTDEAIKNFQLRLENFLIENNSFGIKKEEREFRPHITIATRDLFKKSFYEAWEVFKKKGYATIWQVQSVSLLKHNKKNWDVMFTSQLSE